MSDPFVEMLRMLRDVDGVVGSFIWTRSGSLLARDLPEALESGVLAEASPRIQRLYEAFQSSGDELEFATLAFAQHKLHVRMFDQGFIAVISAIAINMPSLRMALSLVGRRVSAELEQARAAAPQARTSAPQAPPKSDWQRIYRGKPVRD